MCFCLYFYLFLKSILDWEYQPEPNNARREVKCVTILNLNLITSVQSHLIFTHVIVICSGEA